MPLPPYGMGMQVAAPPPGYGGGMMGSPGASMPLAVPGGPPGAAPPPAMMGGGMMGAPPMGASSGSSLPPIPPGMPANFQAMRSQIGSLPQLGPGGALPPQFAALKASLAGMPTSPPPFAGGTPPGFGAGGTPPGAGSPPPYGIGGMMGAGQPGGLDADGGRRRLIMNALAGMGQQGDTMLAHINPQEAMGLMQRGGVGTSNPATGLPQFYPDGAVAGDNPLGGASSDPGTDDDPLGNIPDATAATEGKPSLLDKLKKNPALAGGLLGLMGGSAMSRMSPLGGLLGAALGAGLGYGGKEAGWWGSPSSGAASNILDASDVGGASNGFKLANIGHLLGNLF